MDPLEQIVRDTIRRLDLLDAGERLVLAVSGGPDSLTLLHVLHAVRASLDLWLCVAVLDHGLRDEASAEAAFVCRQAESLGLLCLWEQRDVAGYAERHGLSLEEAAREVRYHFLAEVADAVAGDAVATGHTADDQAETVLMHFLRGAGLSGLKGMRPRGRLPITIRDSPVSEHRPDLVRPLLFTPRSEILAYVERKELQPRFDRSNLDTTFFRNRLRHELLPLLETYQPNVHQVLARTAETLAIDWEYLQEQADAVWHDLVTVERETITVPKGNFLSLHPALQRGLIRRAVRRLRPLERDVSWEQVLEALRIARDGETGDRATLPGDLFLIVGYETLTIGEEPPTPASAWPQLRSDTTLDLPVPGEIDLPADWTLTIRVVPRADLAESPFRNTDGWRAFLDAEVPARPLRLRTRRPGDRFTPLGMDESVELADFLINQKVPAAVRDRMPLLVDADDRILWVAGVRISQAARITDATNRVLVMEFQEVEICR